MVFAFADDPRTTMNQLWQMVGVVWGVAGIFFALLLAGVIGGWVAYRKKRRRLSIGLSMLSVLPIAVLLLGFASLTMGSAISSLWALFVH